MEKILELANLARREGLLALETYANSGGEAVGSTPEELERHIVRELEKWRKVIIAANIKIE